MSTIVDWLTEIIGTYNPNVYSVSEDVQVIASGAAGVDWTWIASAALVLVAVYAVFRLAGVFLGGILK